MLTYSEALERLLGDLPPPREKLVELAAAQGCVLAEEVRADLDLPPFDKAFMDGYAVRSADVRTAPVRLRVVASIPAGTGELTALGPGQAAEIMTGAPVPPGCDAVQMVEKTRRLDQEWVEVLEPVEPGANVSLRGSEVRRGTVVLRRGDRVGPAQVAVLATFGRQQVKVYRVPEAVVIATGSEIVEVDQTPASGQIRNSNAPMLAAQCRRLGLPVSSLGPVADRREALSRALSKGLEKDLVILSGGVSMGRYDLVPEVVREAGVRVAFHKAAIKPGKPILVGRLGDKVVFGLPGNPVSSFVTFELFVRPAVRTMMGSSHPCPRTLPGRLTGPVRHRPGRLFFKPARTIIRNGQLLVEPVDTKGSADIVGFSTCNSLVLVPADCSYLEEGSAVRVILLEPEILGDVGCHEWRKQEEKSIPADSS